MSDIARAGDRYLERLAALKAAVDVPVIASLNATSAGSWVRYAGMLAGADAIELNLYDVAADPDRSALDVVPRLELSSPGSCACRCAGPP